MHGLMMLVALVLMITVYGLAYWMRKSFQNAAEERADIRGDLTKTIYRINAYTAIVDQFPSVRERHLKIVQDGQKP